VTKVEETDECMLVHIDRLGKRLLRCGVCRQRCLEVHDIRREREWRDLSMRKLPLKLRYRPRRVECPRCGVRVEDFPWAESWARVPEIPAHAQNDHFSRIMAPFERIVGGDRHGFLPYQDADSEVRNGTLNTGLCAGVAGISCSIDHATVVSGSETAATVLIDISGDENMDGGID
jgi:hypothetical protein